MASKLKFILLMCVSAGLGFCWYPLVKLGKMQIESSQLLFFAFSAASLLTVFFMAYQVAKWRKRTLELLIFSLIGGVSNALLHYSLLHGNPIGVMGLFCFALVLTLFLDRLSIGKLVAGEFLVILSLTLVAVSLLLATKSASVLHWSQLLAVLAGIGFYKLSVKKNQADDEIPLMSKVAGLLIASTWLVGMILIFSPRSTSFSYENAAPFSAVYGALVLVPIIVSLVFIHARYNLHTFLLWITMLLAVNLMGVVFYSDIASIGSLVWPFFILMAAFGLLFTLWKASSKVGVHSS